MSDLKVEEESKIPVTRADTLPSEENGDIKHGEVINPSTVDEGEIFLQENGYNWLQVEALLNDPAKLKKLTRKIDWILMPLMCGTYCLQFIDKQTMSYGAVFDLISNAHLVGDQYSWMGSIFYLGYLFWTYPSSYLAQRFNIGTYISISILIWGAVLLCTAAASNFAGLAACRFILGCLEAPVTPCFMLVVSMWYSREDAPSRAGYFYCFNGIGASLGGIFTYAIGQMNNFPVYKGIFLVCGGLTVVWGVLMLVFFPKNVLVSKRFTVEEKAMVVGIGKRNQTGVYNRHIKWYQIRECFLDPQIWICFLFAILNELVNGGVANFGNLIIKGLVHGDKLKTIALGIPQGFFTLFFVATGPWFASRFKNSKCIVMALYMVPSIIGSFILWKLPRSNTVGCLFGYYIMSSYVASLVLVLQLPSNNVSGYTKRVTGTAFVFLGYCAGNIAGPHAFLTKEAPYYPTGSKMFVGCTLAQIALVILLRFVLVRRNRVRDAQFSAGGIDTASDEDILMDKTDFEDRRFRYTY